MENNAIRLLGDGAGSALKEYLFSSIWYNDEDDQTDADSTNPKDNEPLIKSNKNRIEAESDGFHNLTHHSQTQEEELTWCHSSCRAHPISHVAVPSRYQRNEVPKECHTYDSHWYRFRRKPNTPALGTLGFDISIKKSLVWYEGLPID
ncbi:hypothetical protein RUM44_012507 [Polyplax serrata]|uniref:Uncharacterized protein n=1 Tax=Polyplax serrata TaxID=468196 RepID=A0ABR1BDK9_POLSC